MLPANGRLLIPQLSVSRRLPFSTPTSLFTMRVLGPLVSLLVSSVIAGEDFSFADCSKEGADVEKCAQKMDSVVEVAPGASYLSKIACKDCSYVETWKYDSGNGKPESKVTHGDQELVGSLQQQHSSWLRHSRTSANYEYGSSST